MKIRGTPRARAQYNKENGWYVSFGFRNPSLRRTITPHIPQGYAEMIAFVVNHYVREDRQDIPQTVWFPGMRIGRSITVDAIKKAIETDREYRTLKEQASG